jgi:hypothetical protein
MTQNSNLHREWLAHYLDRPPERLVLEGYRCWASLLMRKRQEFLKVVELIHYLQCRGMDGVAPEIAQEIVMFLNHGDVNAGPCEQQPYHQARGPGSYDNAILLRHGGSFGIFRLEQCRYRQPGGRTVRDVPGRLAWRLQSGPRRLPGQ